MIDFQRLSRTVVAAALAAGLGACAAKPPPVVVAPPPPPIVIPARPLPPSGAVASMFIPAVDPLGIRQSVNANLTPAQKTWNLRSALNVAALNCLDPRHQPILEGYKVLLKTHKKGLAATNRTLDAEFRDRYGKDAHAMRDAYMTQVYNYFALPPALSDFCDAALVISNESLGVAPADLDAFAAMALPRLEQVYENFFRSFERYRVEVAAWDAQYGPLYGITPNGSSNPLAPVMPAQVPAAPPPSLLVSPVPVAQQQQPQPAPFVPLAPQAGQPGLVVPAPAAANAAVPATGAAPLPGAAFGPAG